MYIDQLGHVSYYISMNLKVNATSAKNNFGTMLEEVNAKKNTITIYRNKKPIAKLVPVNYSKEKSIKALTLNDAEYKKMKEGMAEFRKTFKFSF